MIFNPIKLLYHTVFDRAMNDQHNQNYAENHIAHNVFHAFCCLIDSLDFFLESVLV